MSGLLEFFSDVIGDNLPGAVAFAFIVYIATQIILSMFQHRADRRAYRYERSAATGRMRFEKESYHIEKASPALFCGLLPRPRRSAQSLVVVFRLPIGRAGSSCTGNVSRALARRLRSSTF